MFHFTEDMIPDLENFLRLYYHKILRVNLTTDSFEVVSMLQFEEVPDCSLSEWLTAFGHESVAEEDKDKFLSCTNLDYLKQNMGEYTLSFEYKRKFPHEKYCNSEFIILPSVNYSDDNQICYIFIKDSGLLD